MVVHALGRVLDPSGGLDLQWLLTHGANTKWDMSSRRASHLGVSNDWAPQSIWRKFLHSDRHQYCGGKWHRGGSLTTTPARETPLVQPSAEVARPLGVEALSCPWRVEIRRVKLGSVSFRVSPGCGQHHCRHLMVTLPNLQPHRRQHWWYRTLTRVRRGFGEHHPNSSHHGTRFVPDSHGYTPSHHRYHQGRPAPYRLVSSAIMRDSHPPQLGRQLHQQHLLYPHNHPPSGASALGQLAVPGVSRRLDFH